MIKILIKISFDTQAKRKIQIKANVGKFGIFVEKVRKNEIETRAA